MNAFAGANPVDQSPGELDLPLDKDRIFGDHKGRHKKSIEKRQRKLLGKLPPLKPFLDEDEHILFVTTGCSPTSILEQMVTGWMFIYIRRCLLVFTDKRIIHVPSKPDYSYRNALAEIRYADCRWIKLRGRGLRIKYKNNKSEVFLFIAGKERRKIKALLAETAFDTGAAADPRRTHLCPRCANPLQKAVYLCQQCRLPFKSRAEARKLALLLPGGGYFYTRHPYLGIGDAIVELVLIALVVVSLAEYLNGQQEAIAAVIMFSFFLVIEKLISVFHSNRFVEEYITEDKAPVYYSSTAAG